MKAAVHFISILFLLLSSCSETREIQPSNSEEVSTQRDTSSGQKNINLLTDPIEFPIIGIAQNQKGGAVVIKDNQTYWIQDLLSWPDDVVGKPVKIWGEIDIRNDAPVFIDTSNVISQGIPVENAEEANRVSKRIWIIIHHYELVRP